MPSRMAAQPNTEAPDEQEQQAPTVKAVGYAVDNLTLVAGLNRDGSFDLESCIVDRVRLAMET